MTFSCCGVLEFLRNSILVIVAFFYEPTKFHFRWSYSRVHIIVIILNTISQVPNFVYLIALNGFEDGKVIRTARKYRTS